MTNEMWLLILDTIIMFIILSNLYIAYHAIKNIPKAYNRVMNYLGLNPPQGEQ